MTSTNSNLNFNFAGKLAIVTGGAAGIGFKLTSSYLEAGGKVVVWDYSQDALNNAQKELSK